MSSRATPARPAPAGAAGGFTLVELLIALAMVSLIALLLFSGLRLGTRAWDGVDASAERTGALRLAGELLARTLGQARPARLVFDGEQVAVFGGNPEGVEFAAPLSEHVGVPGIYVLRLSLEGSGKRRDLVLTRWLMHPEILEGKHDNPAWEPLGDKADRALEDLPTDMDAAGGAFGRTLILADVQELEIGYYGTPIDTLGLGGAPGGQPGTGQGLKPRAGASRGLGSKGPASPGPGAGLGPGLGAGLGAGTEADWYEEWLKQSAPPILVRIHLRLPDRLWPDLIVALPASRT